MSQNDAAPYDPWVTLSGAITGLGGIRLSASGFGGQNITLSSTNNDFTGSIKLGQGDTGVSATFNSLADSTNAVEMQIGSKGDTKFVWGSGAVAPLVLANRQIVLSGNQTKNHVIENANADAANTITISQDLSVSRTVDKPLVLGGVNTGANTISGSIPDGAGSVTSLQKKDAGTWVLAGDNTFSGPTTVSGGILQLAGSNCLSDSDTLTINSGCVVHLGAGVRETVDGLTLGSSPQPVGSYGSSSSSAANKNDTYFTGTGVLFVGVVPPPTGSMLMLR